MTSVIGKRNIMTKIEYLYGKYKDDIEDIPKHVIQSRIEALNKHINDLLDQNYLERDGTRINAIMKAKRFWTHINEQEGE